MRSARASLWLTVGSGTQEVLRFLRNVILVRVLLPEAFGAMALVLAFYQFLEASSEMGIREAIVQNPEGAQPSYLLGAWIVSMARSLLLYGVAFAAAPLIAKAYSLSELTPMVRFASVCICLRGAVNPWVYVLSKRIEFRRYVAVFQGGGILGILSTIVLGVVLKSSWALVYGFVIEAASVLLLSFVVVRWPGGHLRLDRRHLRELLSYSKGFVGLPLLNFLSLRTDIFVLGKLASPAEVGLYSVVGGLSSVFSSLASRVVGPVFMPAFTQIVEGKKDLNRALISSTVVLAYICMPAVAFIWASGETLLGWVYTRQYAQLWLPFLLLAMADTLWALNMPVSAAYLSLAKPASLRVVALVRSAVLLSLIYPLSRYAGVTGAACAVLLATVIWHFWQVWRLREVLGVKLRIYLKPYIEASVVAAPLIVAGTLVKLFRPFGDGVVIAGSLSLLALCYLLLVRHWFRAKDGSPSGSSTVV
jgi:lipopolysaccharide exporter